MEYVTVDAATMRPWFCRKHTARNRLESCFRGFRICMLGLLDVFDGNLMYMGTCYKVKNMKIWVTV